MVDQSAALQAEDIDQVDVQVKITTKDGESFTFTAKSITPSKDSQVVLAVKQEEQDLEDDFYKNDDKVLQSLAKMPKHFLTIVISRMVLKTWTIEKHDKETDKQLAEKMLAKSGPLTTEPVEVTASPKKLPILAKYSGTCVLCKHPYTVGKSYIREVTIKVSASTYSMKAWVHNGCAKVYATDELPAKKEDEPEEDVDAILFGEKSSGVPE